MTKQAFEFELRTDVDMPEAERTLRLSMFAVEGLYGEAHMSEAVSYTVEPLRRAIRIFGHAPVPESVSLVFSSLLTKEFGTQSFSLRPDSPQHADATSAA